MLHAHAHCFEGVGTQLHPLLSPHSSTDWPGGLGKLSRQQPVCTLSCPVLCRWPGGLYVLYLVPLPMKQLTELVGKVNKQVAGMHMCIVARLEVIQHHFTWPSPAEQVQVNCAPHRMPTKQQVCSDLGDGLSSTFHLRAFGAVV